MPVTRDVMVERLKLNEFEVGLATAFIMPVGFGQIPDLKLDWTKEDAASSYDFIYRSLTF